MMKSLTPIAALLALSVSGVALAETSMPATPETAATEGKCGGKMADEAKCGGKMAKEAKCGAKKSAHEGKCGAKKSAHEGKCGEAKCGAKR